MSDLDYAKLQRRYGGRYVARRDGEVVADAETYDQLSARLEAAALRWSDLVIEYVEPVGIVGVY